jgi:DNA-binding NarL/FixJ family response regulator
MDRHPPATCVSPLSAPTETSPDLGRLSKREREVTVLANSGATNKEIAYDLGLAHATVRVLRHRAAFKLGLRARPRSA